MGCIEAGGLTIKRLRLVNDSGPVVALEVLLVRAVLGRMEGEIPEVIS